MKLQELKSLVEAKTTDVKFEMNNGHEVRLRVEFTSMPASRGARGRYGVPEEPDEAGYAEINAVYLIKNGKVVMRNGRPLDVQNKLKPDEFERLMAEVHEGDYDDGYDDYDERYGY